MEMDGENLKKLIPPPPHTHTHTEVPESNQVISRVGSSNKHPSKEVIHGLVLFVLNLYCNTRPSDIDTIGSLRWRDVFKIQI